MLINGRMIGSSFKDTINDLINTDKRFDSIPDEVMMEVLLSDDLHDGEVEVFKYNDRCDTF